MTIEEEFADRFADALAIPIIVLVVVLSRKGDRDN